MDSLETIRNKARELANAIFASPDLVCTQDNHCIHKEEERPLTKKEVDLGWTRRPFWAYDPDRMCSACRCYFLQERAAQELHYRYLLARPHKGGRGTQS